MLAKIIKSISKWWALQIKAANKFVNGITAAFGSGEFNCSIKDWSLSQPLFWTFCLWSVFLCCCAGVSYAHLSVKKCFIHPQDVYVLFAFWISFYIISYFFFKLVDMWWHDSLHKYRTTKKFIIVSLIDDWGKFRGKLIKFRKDYLLGPWVSFLYVIWGVLWLSGMRLRYMWLVYHGCLSDPARWEYLAVSFAMGTIFIYLVTYVIFKIFIDPWWYNYVDKDPGGWW